jgi:hypothetical protein
VMIIRKAANGIFRVVFFLLMSYVFSSWHMWHYGGSFGCRPMVEYYALFSIPFAFLLTSVVQHRNLFLRSVVYFFIVMCTIYNLSMTYNYRWVTFSTWAWDDYLHNVQIAGLYQNPGLKYTFDCDFENPCLAPWPNTFEKSHSKTMGGYVDQFVPENAAYQTSLSGILNKPVSHIDISLWVLQPYGWNNTGVAYHCVLVDPSGKVIFKKVWPLDDYIKKADTWFQMKKTIDIPEYVDQNSNIRFSVLNPLKSKMFIDDHVVVFE